MPESISEITQSAVAVARPAAAHPHATRLLMALVLAALALFALLITAAAMSPDSNPGLAPAAGTPAPNCTWVFTDTFTYRDPAPSDPQLSFMDAVTIGGEDYSSTGRNNPGVRIRDFFDSLDPNTRPGHGNYGDTWNVQQAGGLTLQALPGIGVRAGGVGTLDMPNGTFPNSAGGNRTLPNTLQTTSEFVYEIDIADNQMNCTPHASWGTNACAANRAYLSGTDSQNGHDIIMGLGFGGIATCSGWCTLFRRAAGTNVWDNWEQVHTGHGELWNAEFQSPIDPSDALQHYRAHASNGQISVDWNGHLAASGTLLSMIDRPSVMGWAAQNAYHGQVTVGTFANASLKWLPMGRIESVTLATGAGRTFGAFEATDSLPGGSYIQYYFVSPDGATVVGPVSSGATIPATFNTTGVKLRAVLHRASSVEDPSPVLTRWRVQTCLPATPTPTPTGTPRATNTPTVPPPTNTPRPTATPGAFFEVAPLKPAVHLKVDPVLGPPAPPDDQTDWRESDAIWYPLQVYAGLVPFAYADPARPPKLCYWTATGWTCKNGTISLKAYTLRDIQMNGMSYLDEPITVGYARTHEFMKWRQPQYRFDASEYTWVNWLAPGGVTPVCASGQRCVNVEGASAGVSFIVFDVIGTIHWDAIPGVGGPFEYSFANSYRQPLSLAYPRAEP